MKKSSKVTLTILATVALAGCGRRYDPCDSRYFNDLACQDAVRQGGYYYHDVWYRSTYDRPYTYYYNSYHSYIATGGHSSSHSYSSYSHSSSSSSVSRGGFGSTGSHGSSGS
jgi:hypothetical protein